MSRSASRVSSSTPANGVLSQEIKFTPDNNKPENTEPEEPLSFWEQICEVPEDQWASGQEKGYRAYLYEGHAASGQYIALITEPFDIEWVKQRFGGGNYRSLLNNPGGKIIASVRFTIEGESKRKPAQSASVSGAQQTPDNFQTQVLEIMREGQRRQEEFLRGLLDRQQNFAPAQPAAAVDPTTLFRGMVEMFKEMVPAKPEMNLLETIALVEKLRGPDLLTVLKQAREAGIIPGAGAPGGGGSLIEQVNQLKEAADSLGLTSGGGKGFTEALIEKGPEILQAGASLIKEYKAVEDTRLATARTVHAIQQQRAGAVVTPPPAQHAEMPQHVQPPTGVGLEVEAPSPAAQAVITEAEKTDTFVKGKLVELIANGDNGDQIVYFLDSIDRRICNHFEGASVEQLVMFFDADPILKKATVLPRFRAALGEIVDVLNAPDEDIPGSKAPVN